MTFSETTTQSVTRLHKLIDTVDDIIIGKKMLPD
jgi:hypothetical protein